jgi:hypothetical protein
MRTPKTRGRFWTFDEASRAVPYVRRLLATLRESYITCRHLYRKSLRADDAGGIHAEWLKRRDEGVAALEELDRLGIILYQNPLRGIVLFPFGVEVEGDDGATAGMVAFFVYKDSRDEIDAFAFAPDLHDQGGLLGAERPIPAVLKAGKTFLKREEVPPLLEPERENCP